MNRPEKEIVARSHSKQGGPCVDVPEHQIPRGGLIYKISSEGSTTSQGQGPGYWVCPECAEFYPDPNNLRKDVA